MKKSWYKNLFSRREDPEPEDSTEQTDRTDADVQFHIGFKLAAGEEGVRDYVQAAEWYRKAADQDHCLAQFNLGVMYHEGQGVARDDAASLVWFGKAARLGDAGGQFKMGKGCYRASMMGTQVEAPELRIEAYKWFRLATKNGYGSTDINYSGLIQKMSWEEISRGDDRVSTFIPATPKS